MADAPAKVLSRDEAITSNTTPTGRVLGVKMLGEYGLYKVKYVDGRGGEVPAEVNGLYTKGEYARADMLRYLSEMWDMSEEAANKARLKNHREKVSAEEDQSSAAS